MLFEECKKQQLRVFIFGGKVVLGYWMVKQIIYLINSVGKVVNNDEDIGDLFKVVFFEDYNVSKVEIIIFVLDISEYILIVGIE